jgi:hypothetical protein
VALAYSWLSTRAEKPEVLVVTQNLNKKVYILFITYK